MTYDPYEFPNIQNRYPETTTPYLKLCANDKTIQQMIECGLIKVVGDE